MHYQPMHPLSYKQRRSVVNALRRSLREPRQLLALVIALLYGGASLAMIIAVLVLPIPQELLSYAKGFFTGDPMERLLALRGALTVTLLLLATTAIFQNPLLQFAPADVDVLFATPVSLRAVLASKLAQNHLRTFFAGYFFWGLTLAPALRLAGLDPWPLGAWALVGLTCLFAGMDQAVAALHMFLLRDDDDSGGERSLWLRRVALVLIVGAILVGVIAVLARIVAGNWLLFDALLRLIGGPLASILLLPIGFAGDLLFLPTVVRAGNGFWEALLPLAGLLLFDLLTGLLLLRRPDGLREMALAPDTRTPPLTRLLRASGGDPRRIAAAVWSPDQTLAERPHTSGRGFGEGARAHIWRRWIEIRRTPIRSLLAVLVLGLVPLALYEPSRGYSLTRLLSAIIFSTSLGTQLFADVADHLRYAALELPAPITRSRLLAGALLPRIALYWLGGLVLLVGIGLTAHGALWSDLLLLAFWYPLVLLPLLALRGVLVFLFPAAGIPGQRDPVQAVLIMLANGLLVLVVIALTLIPFGILLALVQIIGIGYGWFWPVVFLGSATLCALTWGLLVWSYRRYEPGEAG